MQEPDGDRASVLKSVTAVALVVGLASHPEYMPRVLDEIILGMSSPSHHLQCHGYTYTFSVLAQSVLAQVYLP